MLVDHDPQFETTSEKSLLQAIPLTLVMGTGEEQMSKGLAFPLCVILLECVKRELMPLPRWLVYIPDPQDANEPHHAGEAGASSLNIEGSIE